MSPSPRVNCRCGSPLEPGSHLRRSLCLKCWQEFKEQEINRSRNPIVRGQTRRYFEGKRP